MNRMHKIETINVFPVGMTPDGTGLQRKHGLGMFPRHKIKFWNYGKPESVGVHTAGSNVIWEASLQDLLGNKRFISGLHPEDAMRLGWCAAMESEATSRREIQGMKA